MKKKLFFTTILAMLLSFGIMANTKSIKHSETSDKVRLNPVIKKETKKVMAFCIRVTLSCGITGVACGENLAVIIAGVLQSDEALCVD